MLVFDSNKKAILLDDVHAPVVTDHIWVLDLNIKDFTLSSFLVLEEIVSPTHELMIDGFKFNLPSNWNILIVDQETLQLDVVEVSELAGSEFYAVIYGPNMPMAECGKITVTDYKPSFCNVGPSLSKHQMLCHPISPYSWVNVSHSDLYNKYLKNAIIGDLV